MPEFKNSQEKIPQKEKFDMVDEIPLDTLDMPRIIEGKNGKLAFGTDIGVNYPKPTNEDALVINTKKNSFAVIDGMATSRARSLEMSFKYHRRAMSNLS